MFTWQSPLREEMLAAERRLAAARQELAEIGGPPRHADAGERAQFWDRLEQAVAVVRDAEEALYRMQEPLLGEWEETRC